MKIIKLNKVHGQIIEELIYILNKCQEHDGSFRDPYLANTYNYDLNMPWLYVAIEQERFVGFLSVYADSLDEAEVALYVLPEYRNKGIARKLYKKLIEACRHYKIQEICFITEKIFLEKHPNIIGVWGTKQDPESEFLLIKDNASFDIAKDDRFDVVLANSSHINQVAKFQSEAFSEDMEVARNYVSQSIKDESTHLYIIIDKKTYQVLGSTSVEVSSDCNYLFGLAMHKEFRGKGIAKYFIKNVIDKLEQFNGKPYQLSVVKSNEIAKSFYRKLGFETQTEVIYLCVELKLDKEI